MEKESWTGCLMYIGKAFSVDYFSFISYALILFISTISQTFKNLLLLLSLFLQELTQIT